MTDCSHLQHQRTREWTPTAAAIYERRERFHNSISARAVKDNGIDLKRRLVGKNTVAIDAPFPRPLDGDFIAEVAIELKVLKKIESGRPNREYTIREIQKAVCLASAISLTDMISMRRPSFLVRPRQIAMAICKELTLRSLPEIGRRFNRDHTTVLHATRKMQPVMACVSDILAEAPVEHIARVALERCKELIPPPKHPRPNRYKKYDQILT